MFLEELSVPLVFKGLGTVTLALFAKAGVRTVADLLRYYPRTYEDRTRTVLLCDFQQAKVCSTVTVIAHRWFGYGAMRTLKVYIQDESASAALLCFNRPFLENMLIIGKRYTVCGQFYYKYGEIQSSVFDIESIEKASFRTILPIYPLHAGLNQTTVRKIMRQALERYGPTLEEELPTAISAEEELCSYPQALKAVHFPTSLAELEQARRTLIYTELFYLEWAILQGTLSQKRHESPSSPGLFSPLQNRLIHRLPFSLTADQEKVTVEINQDLDNQIPMARLLQGDVGSGKTLVSFLASLRIIEQGFQVALMAPTELLARQHAENAAQLLEPLGVHVAFLTGGLKSAHRSQVLEHLSSGDIDIIVGTHALFSKDVSYHALGLVIVDEQHRFGVNQRQALLNKGNAPNFLMMSATPIPRTLAFTVFGDLDISTIKELPPGRKPIETHSVQESHEMRVYTFVEQELKSGHQAYFVYPLIEESEELSLKNAVSMAEHLSHDVFPSYTVGLIHSKLDEEEKRYTMELFRNNAIHVLVATSIVEVGVDVPNASCMVIEHAERFGLSTLHQLRGRIGRGSAQAYCFLVYSNNIAQDGKERLRVMREHTDGFLIAEEDLKLRGPGQIIGTEQSGYHALGIADPVADADILERARKAVQAIIASDSSLEQPEHHCIKKHLHILQSMQYIV